MPERKKGSSTNARSVTSRPSKSTGTSSLDGSPYADLFKLQLDELLGRLRPKYGSKKAKVESEVHRLRSIIEAIPNFEGLPAPEAQLVFQQSNNVRIPFPEAIPLESSTTLAYASPTNISIVGSYARKTALLLDGHVTVDVAVTMPPHIFQINDYRDYRYFQKRAFYLACLAAGIQKANPPALAVLLAYQDDNPLQPILTIQPTLPEDAGRMNPSWMIRLLLAANDDIFPLAKTFPTKSCTRVTRHDAVDTPDDHATPIYNATLRSECCSLSSLKQLHQASVRSAAFQDACMLGAVWLHQRGFGSSRSTGGFGQFEWATMISLLMQDGEGAGRPILSTGYSSYQLFRATLLFLSTTDLQSSPMIVRSTSLKLTHSKNPLLFDGSRGLNILFKMSPWSYDLLRLEAQTSLKAINDPLVGHFKALFIKKVDEPSMRFDYVFRVRVKEGDDGVSRTGHVPDRAADLANVLHEKLSYGLGDRARLVYPQIPSVQPWQLDLIPSHSSSRAHVAVGLLLNPEHCSRTVDRGPRVENKDASTLFRRFWGEKAELRRFKDGTILESLIWDTSGSKRAVIDLIISHVLRRHLRDYEQENDSGHSEAFDRLLPQPASTQPNILGPFSAAMTSFEHLMKSIRAMEGLPLQIRQIFPTSPALRYSSLHAPATGMQERPVRPIEFLIQFEGSTRWPANLVAVQRTKAAFLLKVAEGLETDELVMAVRLRLEKPGHKLLEDSCLDIKTTDGLVFRLQIYHEHELSMLEQALNGRMPCSAPREEIALALSQHKRRFIQRPTHTQAVSTLVTRHPLLSPTIRLLKYWRDCHLLSLHLADELLELIAIHTFISPYPWPSPGSLNSAFLRTLAFIASWNWQSDPLIVDFTSELDTPALDAIRARFDAWRKLDPGMNRMAMFAASNLDREGITWTDRRPAKMIAARFTKLAHAACELVKGKKGLELEPEALFVPSLVEYDFVIHLEPTTTTTTHRGKNSAFKNLRIESETAGPFDATIDCTRSFVGELEALYGDDVIFFYNESAAASVIAGLWNPQTGAPRNWKVGLHYSTMPLDKGEEEGGAEQQVTINKTGILCDIARLGGDMVRKIDRKMTRA
ncbi:MAG: hypothetical protein Q9223_003784 [Gallowayella weberi]